MTRISRRSVLRVISAGSVLGLGESLAGCDDDTAVDTGYFSDAQRLAIGALANVVVPPEEGSPGAAELGAAAFIERLLTAFDSDPPALFAEGPYSGRQPFNAGALPPNDFARFRRLDRITERAWRIKLFGSKAAGASLNEGLVPEVIGLRDLFEQGIPKAMTESAKPLHLLSPAEIRDVFAGLDTDLQKAFLELVPQAVFGAPEYGGNPSGKGWALVHFEGDSQPLGYSLFDEASATYRDRPDAPVTVPDGTPDPSPIDDETRALLAQVVAFTDGKVFP